MNASPRRRPYEESLAIRMAIEGVPVAAIGRVMRRSPALVRVILGQAIAAGILKAEPPAEWASMLVPRQAIPLRYEPDPAAVGALALRLMSVARIEVPKQMAKLLALLGTMPIVDDETIIAALVTQQVDPAYTKIVDVLICKLRPYARRVIGLEIETVWGVGYRIDAANKARLFAWLEQQGTRNDNHPGHDGAGAGVPLERGESSDAERLP